MLLRLFIAALWSPAANGPTSCLLSMMLSCVFVTFPCGILGQVRYLIVLIPDLCLLSYIDCCFVVVTEKQQNILHRHLYLHKCSNLG